MSFRAGRRGKPVAGAEFVKEPIPEFAKRLRSLAGKDIWMMGGAGIIASFLDAKARSMNSSSTSSPP